MSDTPKDTSTVKEISCVCEVLTNSTKKWKKQLIVYDQTDQFLYVYPSEKRLRPSNRMVMSKNIFLKHLKGREREEKRIEHGFMLLDKTDMSYVRLVFDKEKICGQMLTIIAKECDCYGCFGLPLEVVISENGLPRPIFRSIQFLLESDHLETDGLFRVSPAGSLLTQVQNRLDKGKDIDPSEFADPNVAAGIIKSYLRSLPNSLIPVEFASEFLDIARLEKCDEIVNALKEFFTKLPSVNYHVLQYLFYFLTFVMNQSDKNKMVAGNIAIVFAPNLLFLDDNEESLYLTKNVNDVVSIMVENYSKIFDSISNFPGEYSAYDPLLTQKDYEEIMQEKKKMSRRSMLPGFSKMAGLRKSKVGDKPTNSPRELSDNTDEKVFETLIDNSPRDVDDAHTKGSGGLMDAIKNFSKDHLKPAEEKQKEKKEYTRKDDSRRISLKKTIKLSDIDTLSTRITTLENSISGILQILLSMNETLTTLAEKNGIQHELVHLDALMGSAESEAACSISGTSSERKSVTSQRSDVSGDVHSEQVAQNSPRSEVISHVRIPSNSKSENSTPRIQSKALQKKNDKKSLKASSPK
ncbi:RalA-binding protein [Entamoeba marina]